MEINTNISKKLLEGLDFELRTLLNGFSGPVQLLKYKVDDPDFVDLFRLLDTSLSRLERLAIRSSIISSMNEGFTNFSKTSINIIDTIRFCVLEFNSTLNLENLKINISEQPNNVVVFGNNDLLLNLFQILLEIAISLSKENSSIDIDITNVNKVICIIHVPTANFPPEMNLSTKECMENSKISWDYVLAKEIAQFHDCQINLIKDEEMYNTFEIVFN